MPNQIFFEDFENEKDIESSFQIKLPATVHILFAYYSHENYEGKAFVLFEEKGKLYEVNGFHCSCEAATKQAEIHGQMLETYIKKFIELTGIGIEKLVLVEGRREDGNGLEGEWEPEETTKTSILHRCEKGRSLEKYAKEVIDILDRWTDAEFKEV